MDGRKLEKHTLVRVARDFVLPVWRVVGDDLILTSRGEILSHGELVLLVDNMNDVGRSDIWHILTRFGTRYILRASLKRATEDV